MFGCENSSNSVSMESLMVPNFECNISWCGLSSPSLPTVRTRTMEQRYRKNIIRTATQNTASMARAKPNASMYSCFRKRTMRKIRRIRNSLMMRKMVARSPAFLPISTVAPASRRPRHTIVASKAFQRISGFSKSKYAFGPMSISRSTSSRVKRARQRCSSRSHTKEGQSVSKPIMSAFIEMIPAQTHWKGRLWIMARPLARRLPGAGASQKASSPSLSGLSAASGSSPGTRV
mmetsp:Transcript_8489/g.24929  ORF Transcript_8489/g.24929 Transcript_8489/m.24929 type:complete len:233 (+) Transcript_8489:1101-1799(+)